MSYIWNSLNHKYKPIASFVKCASEIRMEKPAPKLLEKVREILRLKHYSPKTEESSVHWIRQFVRYYHLRHPRELGAQERKEAPSQLGVFAPETASRRESRGASLQVIHSMRSTTGASFQRDSRL